MNPFWIFVVAVALIVGSAGVAMNCSGVGRTEDCAHSCKAMGMVLIGAHKKFGDLPECICRLEKP